MNQSSPPAYLISLFPFFFAGLWCTVSLVLSAGGWRQLSKSFPARDQPSGKRFFGESAKVGLVAYNRCLTIYTSPEGIYLSVFLPFRLGHPPLFIPWDAMHNASEHRFLWLKTIAFDVGTPRITTMRLARKIFEDRELVD